MRLALEVAVVGALGNLSVGVWTWVESVNGTGFVEVAEDSECGLLVAAQQPLQFILNISEGSPFSLASLHSTGTKHLDRASIPLPVCGDGGRSCDAE